MQVFLEAGLAMIDESPDTRRTFIESLATESGLRKVRQIVETDFAVSYSVLKPMFDPHCILFFQLVSHNEVLFSLILEKAVGTIYNVIYGPGGRRAIGFFTKVTDYLTQFKSDGRSQAVVQHVATPSEVLSLVSRVLLGTLTLNHEAAIQVDLKHAISSDINAPFILVPSDAISGEGRYDYGMSFRMGWLLFCSSKLYRRL